MPLIGKTYRPALLAVDTETTGMDFRHGARPFFVSTCDGDGNVRWWEWPVDPATRCPSVPAAELAAVASFVRSAGTLVLQNARFDVRALWSLDPRIGDSWRWGATHDLLIASHLLASNRPKNLTALAAFWLGRDITPLEERLAAAVKDARSWVRRKLPGWQLAKEGRPDMPSAKGECWRADYWLPAACARHGRAALDPAKRTDDWATVLRDYATADAELTALLFGVLQSEIAKRGLGAIYEAGRETQESCWGMEQRGIGFLLPEAAALEGRYRAEREAAEAEMTAIAAEDRFALELPKGAVNDSLREYCFGPLALLAKVRTETGQPAMNKAAVEGWLDELEPESRQGRFVRAMARKRGRDTALGYLESYHRFGVREPGGCDGALMLHPSINMTGTDTLRASSSNPNGQQISKREDANLRAAFGPTPGREWWSFDFENIELRIPAYESGEPAMIALFEKPDDPPFFGSYHLLNASIVYPDLFWPLAEQRGEFKKRYAATWYQWCKNGGFAIQYGCQEAKADATFRRKGAYRAIKEKMPRVAELNARTVAFANRHGYVETMPDREVDPARGYPLLLTRSDWGRVSPTEPLNYRVQGTAMWVTRRAMVRVRRFLDRINGGGRFAGRVWPGGYWMILQVHDELDFDFPAGGERNLPVAREIKRLMESAGDGIGVPLKVSMGLHRRTWADEEKM